MVVVLEEGIFWTGILIFLSFAFTSAVGSTIIFWHKYEYWWGGRDAKGRKLKPEDVKVRRAPHQLPDEIMPLVWLINYGLLVVGNFIIWQYPIFINPANDDVQDKTDTIFDGTTKGYYLAILSLGFIEWLMPPLWMYVVFRRGQFAAGIWVCVLECSIMIVLTTLSFLLYWLAGIFFAIYLAYAVYALSVNVALYIINRPRAPEEKK